MAKRKQRAGKTAATKEGPFAAKISKPVATKSERGFEVRGNVNKETRTKLAELVTHYALHFLRERERPPQTPSLWPPISEADLQWSYDVERSQVEIERTNERKKKALDAFLSMDRKGKDTMQILNALCDLMNSNNVYFQGFCPHMSAVLDQHKRESPVLFGEMWSTDCIHETFAEGGTDITLYGQIDSIINYGNIELAERTKPGSWYFIDPDNPKESFPIAGY